MDTRLPRQDIRSEPRKELEEQLRLRRQVQGLEDRDLQLWSIVCLMIVLLLAGLSGLLLPNVVWNRAVMHFEGRFLPQLFYGLITLVVLFNIYVMHQRRHLRHAREELVLQMVYNEAAERLSVVDPLTQVFNRRYMDSVLTTELKRAERQNLTLGFLMIDVNDFKGVNTNFGHLTGDRILMEVADLLKHTFRASDTIIRFGGDEFLIVLDDANEEKIGRATTRLQVNIGRWNNSPAVPNFVMSLSWGFALYAKGSNLQMVLDAADRNMYKHKAVQTAGQPVV